MTETATPSKLFDRIKAYEFTLLDILVTAFFGSLTGLFLSPAFNIGTWMGAVKAILTVAVVTALWVLLSTAAAVDLEGRRRP